MAKYCQEKFEELNDGTEVIVYWRQDQHNHDASFISDVARQLGVVRGGNWQVRKNSYQSNLSSPPDNGVDRAELFA
ncbi:MAG TPA: hypothetical protein VFQ45_08880 [Longimicrobium sp.]|nr:hypothetical protein [Longimicrobium sp.]